MAIYMSRERWDPYNWFIHGDVHCISQERVAIHRTGLTMQMYMSREGCDPYNWFNHGDVYVKRGSGYH